jgi:hypothetical protein
VVPVACTAGSLVTPVAARYRLCVCKPASDTHLRTHCILYVPTFYKYLSVIKTDTLPKSRVPSGTLFLVWLTLNLTGAPGPLHGVFGQTSSKTFLALRGCYSVEPRRPGAADRQPSARVPKSAWTVSVLDVFCPRSVPGWHRLRMDCGGSLGSRVPPLSSPTKLFCR